MDQMNDRSTWNNITLIGFSGTGKSAVAPKLAAALGWAWIDMDNEISKLAGKNIQDIFAQDGEPRFRALERQVLESTCKKSATVISAGGGAAVDQHNRDLMHRCGMVVLLEATPETIYKRLQGGMNDAASVRPLLAGPDPLKKIRDLKHQRQPSYAAADWTVHTDNLSLEEVTQEIVHGWDYWRRSYRGGAVEANAVATVTTSTRSYPIIAGWGTLEMLGANMTAAGLSGSAFVISDETLRYIYGDRILRFLEQAGFKAQSMSLPPGETSKTLASVQRVYDFLVNHRAERSDVIVAFGGGVIGDIAGFVAATFLRGIAFVQVPTTLVAMVDASIGGKTGVDHPQGKNLIGAFYQPSLVLADVQLLTTLERRELMSGWAEVIKHGLILDAELFEYLDSHADSLKALEEEAVVYAVSRSAQIKAQVVSEDERETTGRRTLLNYGHTIAHGIETATDYKQYAHGEAVSIGMVGAAMLAERRGLVKPNVTARHKEVLEKFELPVSSPDVSQTAVLKAMETDKKVKRKAIRWVLLKQIGKAVVRSDVSEAHVREILTELGMK
ncbi:MAG: 3-dehydroquinate synthase [Chloroflexi bacterium]|nr:3-dehydroquinate synthase [Chloroflexota bacterium]